MSPSARCEPRSQPDMPRIPQQSDANPPKNLHMMSYQQALDSATGWMWRDCGATAQQPSQDLRARLKTLQAEQRIETGCESAGMK